MAQFLASRFFVKIIKYLYNSQDSFIRFGVSLDFKVVVLISMKSEFSFPGWWTLCVFVCYLQAQNFHSTLSFLNLSGTLKKTHLLAKYVQYKD